MNDKQMMYCPHINNVKQIKNKKIMMAHEQMLLVSQ